MPAQLMKLSKLDGRAGRLAVAAFVAFAAVSLLRSGKPPPPAAVAERPVRVDARLGPDDYALRYYASLNLTRRVDAEIARLKRLYPDYEPPSDLYTQTAGSEDEGPLWALYSADRLQELRAAIEVQAAETPGWKPSSDLMLKLRRKELRQRLSPLATEGRWREIAALLETLDVDPGENDVDIRWVIAEAYARTRREALAAAQFKQILADYSDRKIQIATVQKAIGLLRMSDVEKLLESMPPDSDGSPAYRSIMIDITRERMAAFLHDERAEEVPAADFAAFEMQARESRKADQLGLVAWYDYKRRDFQNALEWFKAAIANGGDAMIAHGLAHTLRALGKLREAEEVAYAWRQPLVNNSILFIDLLERDLTRTVPPYIEAERLARYARTALETTSGEGAQALAWYAYNSCQVDIAAFWFERAVAWLPKDASVFGYALSLQRLRRGKEFYELANRYDGLDSKLIELLFPDDYYHPPTPCSGKTAGRMHGASLRMAEYPVPGPALIPGAAPNYDQTAWSSPITDQKNASQPGEGAAPGEKRLARVLRNLKGRFPAAVTPENPLRFRQLGATGRSAPPLRNDPALHPDPARGLAPLVARRVPGIGAMPYERYGFSLLPGWNGIESATWPPASEQHAPPGSQWSEQEADPTLTAAVPRVLTQPGPAAGMTLAPLYSRPPSPSR